MLLKDDEFEIDCFNAPYQQYALSKGEQNTKTIAEHAENRARTVYWLSPIGGHLFKKASDETDSRAVHVACLAALQRAGMGTNDRHQRSQPLVSRGARRLSDRPGFVCRPASIPRIVGT